VRFAQVKGEPQPQARAEDMEQNVPPDRSRARNTNLQPRQKTARNSQLQTCVFDPKNAAMAAGLDGK
jgi:hypothetical protein